MRNVRKISGLDFDQLLDLELIREFVRWHVNEQHQRVTQWIVSFVSGLGTIAYQYQGRPDLHETLKQIQRELGKPARVYDKNEVWVSLYDIEHVGRALWPRKIPAELEKNGGHSGTRASLSLMLRLWCRRPYRQRNMREMMLNENLYRGSSGEWQIHFAGEQLKIAEKRGRPNTFVLGFPKDLVGVLEEYLRTWRPALNKISGGNYPHVFLNRRGEPFRLNTLTEAVKRNIYAHVGRACPPHQIRTIWATEYIRSTGDYYRAAVMLNDSLETVVQCYSHLRDQGVAEATDRWVREQVSTVPLIDGVREAIQA